MNVLLVTIDAWRASHASFAGAADRQYTPNLDALAADGVVFTQAVSHGPSTPYAFPALFTSTLPLDHGGYERISPERPLVSEPLHAAGYRCIGVHGNPWLGAKYGYGRGYDDYRDVGEFRAPGADRVRELLIDRFGLDHPMYRAAQTLFRRMQGPMQRLRGENDEVNVARRLLAASDGDRFVWVHLLSPHAPYAPPRRHREWAGVPPSVDAVALTTRAQRTPDALSAAEREAVRRLYAASVHHADERVGDLLRAVDDRWLVVVTADHGEALFEHGQVGHEPALFDELLHVPLLVRPPAGTPVVPRRVDAQVRHVDVAPTILEYAGVDPPPTFTGRSLRPLVEGATGVDRVAVSEVASTRTTPGRVAPDALQIAVRLPGRKVVEDGTGRRGYDLVADPGESTPIPSVDLVGPDWEPLLATMAERRERVRSTLGGDDSNAGRDPRDATTEQRLRDLGYLE
ncbi:sulfatase [Halomarina litorea]|uniref:sulfatase n=1 Tax=Halomarina litorea TaxID=2961595 RepID=UPI0020C2FF99|nr:sulfatase [Halomarina sp. BCD28]